MHDVCLEQAITKDDEGQTTHRPQHLRWLW